MNEVVKNWVAALRSGEYKQGTGAMCAYDNYCCLGVLCEVVGFEKRKAPATRRSGFPIAHLKRCDYDVTEVYEYKMPALDCDALMDPWNGYSIQDLYFDKIIGKTTLSPHYLATLNDRGMPFVEIADYIESTIDVYGSNGHPQCGQ